MPGWIPRQTSHRSDPVVAGIATRMDSGGACVFINNPRRRWPIRRARVITIRIRTLDGRDASRASIAISPDIIFRLIPRETKIRNFKWSAVLPSNLPWNDNESTNSLNNLRIREENNLIFYNTRCKIILIDFVCVWLFLFNINLFRRHEKVESELTCIHSSHSAVATFQFSNTLCWSIFAWVYSWRRACQRTIVISIR